MEDTEKEDIPDYDIQTLQRMNDKAIQNNFFTPDKVYLDLSLLKDLPIGAIYADKIINNDEQEFLKAQTFVLSVVTDYQKRLFDTVDPYFGDFGYTDEMIDEILQDQSKHGVILIASPATYFLETLIRHTVRNQNNSRPAHKYTKKMLDKDQYVMEPIDVTYHINTYPLSLSHKALTSLGAELGEALGVNIVFLNKDPGLFDKRDWDEWLKDIDCFYLNSLGRFTGGDYIYYKQGRMELVGRYVFARKRLEKQFSAVARAPDFDHQIQSLTAQADMFCDFKWLQNNDVRLTQERENIPIDDPESDDNDGTPS